MANAQHSLYKWTVLPNLPLSYLVYHKLMIGLCLQVGTANTKIGFTGESLPRLQTQSILITPDSPRLHYEQDLFSKPQERIFSNSLNPWRNDIIARPLFSSQWTSPTLPFYSIEHDNFLRFLQELVKEIRERKQRGMNDESCDYALAIVQPSHLKKHEQNKFRQQITTMVFDELRLSGLYFIKSSVANTFAQGRTSAIVVDSGHTYSSVSRVLDGYEQQSTILNFGGNSIDHQIQELLTAKNLINKTNYPSIYQKNAALGGLWRMKELLACKQGFKIQESADIEHSSDVQFELPDKEIIHARREDAREPFTHIQEYRKSSSFSIPTSYHGLARTIADIYSQQSSKNISSAILTGGNILFSDLKSRLTDQLSRSLSNRNLPIPQIIPSRSPLVSSWQGMSIVSSLQSFSGYWCTPSEYRQYGWQICNKKCPT